MFQRYGRHGLIHDILRAGACRPCLVLVFGLVSGCASLSRQVDRQMLVPFGAPRHEVREDQRFLMAAPILAPDPAYPQDAPDVSSLALCVSFVVNTEGMVEDVAVIDDPACPDSRRHARDSFGQAVVSAVSRWSFFGAAICDFPPGVPADDACEGEGVLQTPVAIRLAYVFSFDARRGRRSVSSRPR